jgi:hypothetical protein
LLAYGARALEGRLVDTDASAVTGFTARYGNGVHPAKLDETGELNDASWEQAVIFAVDLADSLDGPVTVKAFQTAMLAVMQAAGRELMSDVDPTHLTALKARRSRRSGPRPSVADIAAIAGTEYRAVVVSLINRTDTAFGILDHHNEPALEHPLLSDSKEIRNGHWPIVGHDPTLVARFPTPERFHRPRASPAPTSANTARPRVSTASASACSPQSRHTAQASTAATSANSISAPTSPTGSSSDSAAASARDPQSAAFDESV